MISSKKIQNESLPSLPVRWFIFFRLQPYAFLQPTYLFNIIVRHRRFPVLWDSVMEAEKQRIRKKSDNLKIQLESNNTKNNF